jgi:hypothetical protein
MNVTSESRALQHRLCGFGLLLVFAGAVGVGGLEVAKRRIAQTAQWPSVTGRIIKSQVATGAVKNGRTLIISDHADTIYTFTVNGKSYRGESRRVVPMLHFNTEGSPEEVVAKYAVGKSVTVYYDPNNPADALLTPVPDESARTLISSLGLIAPVLGGVGLLIAGIAGLQLWRERGLVPPVPVVPTAIAPTLLPPVAPVLQPVALPRPPKPPRTTHWIVRAIATLFGLALFLFGTLVTLTTLRLNNPAVSDAMQTTMIGIFSGVTLFGAFLIWVGMRRTRTTIQTA